MEEGIHILEEGSLGVYKLAEEKLEGMVFVEVQ
jgi:hypothetical protein